MFFFLTLNLMALGCHPTHRQHVQAPVEELSPSTEPVQAREQPVVEVAESGIPDHVAHKVDATLSDLLARDPVGPYGVYVDFQGEPPSLEMLAGMGLMPPRGGMTAGYLSRDDLFALVELDCVVAISGFEDSYLKASSSARQ
ncbi:MAG: hypothetical protein HN348_05435 [Proteobacteria bacterium]|nr:hypothetical protein [Pseudomonadota bacterium]